MAARRAKRRRFTPIPSNRLVIRFMGDPGTGKTTAMQAVRLLLQDAGAEVSEMEHGGPGEFTGEPNMLVARTSPEILRELGEWMKQEPT
jgi:Cdc6-like AAA superfamily ATPase